MKKTIALLLALIMLLSAVPAVAADVRTSGLYTYEIKGNGTITIVGFDWINNDGDIYIPIMIDGYTVTGIGNEAFAHAGKNGGVSVTLPEGIKSIGEKAFFKAGITSINLPSSLQLIGSAAFYGNSSCDFKPVPNHPYFAVIDEGLYNKSKKELIAYSWANHIKGDRVITIPEGIQAIGAFALAGMDDGVKHYEIILPSTLVSIGDYAFANIEEKSTPDYFHSLTGNLSNLKTIGEGAFMQCRVYECSLTMSAVETIGSMAFQKADLGKVGSFSIDFSGSPLNRINDNAFVHNSLFASDNYNVFIVPTENCGDIGSGNSGLGMIMTEESDFSPALTTVPAGLNPQVSSLPSTVTAIETGAFAKEVTDFRLSTSLNDIAVDAFPKGSTFIVDAGSYAELWCSENGFGYTVEGQEDDLSWLNS